MLDVMTANFVRLTRLETALGVAQGVTHSPPRPHSAEAPRSVLERLICEATVDPRQYVAFSGGRDSSAVLAVATKVARERQADDPIPVTLRYPGVAEADETEWQQLVIRHLGLTKHVIIDVRDEQRLLGEPAQRAMRRRGVVWPSALQLREVGYADLGGGSLLTGEVGDHVFDPQRITVVRNLIRQRRRPSKAMLRRSMTALAPQWLTSRRRPSQDDFLPWLRGDARPALEQVMLELEASRLSWASCIWHVLDPRAQSVILHNDAVATREYGLEPFTPFAHPEFRAALAHSGGFWGYEGRTQVMRALFADLLPDALLSRSTKAGFGGARWGDREREFARDWDGSGVDPELIDAEQLRREWLSDRPMTGADFQLQQAWAYSEGIVTPQAPG